MNNISTKRSTVVANNVPVAPGCSPTGWWRSIAAPNFHPMALGAMKAAVEKVEMLAEPSRRDAVAGDTAAAVGMAILFDRQKAAPGKLDLVMTALVIICACEGNATACVVVSNIIRRLPNSGEREARVATSWLMRAFRPFADRHLVRG
jgi:hypothetical protein